MGRDQNIDEITGMRDPEHTFGTIAHQLGLRMGDQHFNPQAASYLLGGNLTGYERLFDTSKTRRGRAPR